MKIVYNNFIPFKGFSAINLFGIFFARKGVKISKKIINHELIHTAQMKELYYVLFYIIYIYYYAMYGYKDNPFEREAYLNQSNDNYLNERIKFSYKNYFIKKKTV